MCCIGGEGRTDISMRGNSFGGMRRGHRARPGKERDRQGQRRGRGGRLSTGTLNGMERGCKRRTKETHREGKGLTRTKERKWRKTINRNTHWDGTRKQEKEKGHAQGMTRTKEGTWRKTINKYKIILSNFN
ncbi:uncharacterized protein [Oscarella lobularis]|uniref:uncharacterized protein n=1 Tax=Oscarella lobularis TaxID=121494 RepID=UPI0033131C35